MASFGCFDLQFPASEFEIRVSNSTSSQVWRFFGDLYHRGNLVCDRVYCSPCFENQRMGEGLNYYLGALMPRIKHYAKSVSTGNLAIHLYDKHNIATGGPSSSLGGRPGRSRSRSKLYPAFNSSLHIILSIIFRY